MRIGIVPLYKSLSLNFVLLDPADDVLCLLPTTPIMRWILRTTVRLLFRGKKKAALLIHSSPSPFPMHLDSSLLQGSFTLQGTQFHTGFNPWKITLIASSDQENAIRILLKE
jgi:hypothetical protein